MTPTFTALLIGLTAPAAAQVPLPPPPPTHLDALVLTRVPDVLGAGVIYEGVGRVRLGGSAGFIPQGYANIVDDIARDLDAWDEATGYVVGQLLPGSATLRADVGWRPLVDREWSVAVGYQRMWLGGSVNPYEVSDVLEDEITELSTLTKEDKVALQDNPDLTIPEILVGAGLHQVTFETGYQWETPERLLLRMSLGAAVTLGARSEVTMDDITYDETTIATEPYRDQASAALDDALRKHFHTPTLGIAVGYRFR